MAPPALVDAERDVLRAELEALDCVRRAVVDADPRPTVYLVCDGPASGPVEMLARSVMARHGLAPGDAELLVSFLPAPEPRRRVRFVAAHLRVPRPGRAFAEVELEWAGETYREEVEGESGAALELRLAALATLRTLDAILQGRAAFQLVGIKSIRAFDADVVVALLRGSDAGGAPLIGAALAAGDPYRSAALAVLNATNRVLGNYLVQAEEQ